MSHGLSRRSFVAAAALPLIGPAFAQGTVATTLRVGAFTVEPVRDGLFPLEPRMIPGADSEAGRALLREAGLPPAGPSPEPVNAFLVRRGERLWLLDAGCGGVLGPDLGKVPAALVAGGIHLAGIETIWLTHLHADHAGGLLDADGRARFARAELVVQAAEVAYWSDPGSRSRAPAEMGAFFDTALAVLAAYKGRVRQVSGAAELTAGITAVPLPGHTPGHAGVLIEDAGERLLIWGDVLHARILQLPHPEWTVIWDMDGAQAEATRRRIFDRAVVEGLTVAGMHLATHGRIARRGQGYALVS
ncbi:MBL fold metallo-hydrolase [Methylobacterium sp. BTF04]|uniref:MBL fold metallo-hydrolase n=1 Tax=Methylobacterium sp. BTF04 TaxID=2708300 RepID=UPI0013CFECEB|nr:MBL fold metallo-hydrolase [Methylobacterium sp. BTF04]NEU13613.1 MBL fold metallo-hydrolase [Methylobacterium sp. BTF04]